MKWKVFNKLCKKEHLKKRNIKPVSFDNDNFIKKGLYWEVPMKDFQGQDFYHTFGVPGIFFNGFLPIKEIERIQQYITEDALEIGMLDPDTADDSGFAYYDLEIKNVDAFYEVLKILRRIRWNDKKMSLELV